MRDMKFGRLSKATLVQLLGLADNYWEYEDVCDVSEIQILSEECKMCKCYAESVFAGDCQHYCEACASCPFYKSERQYQSRKIKKYKNESNTYGTKKKVGKSAIKIWIALHFCAPDDMGLVRQITIAHLSKLTGLSTRQVKDNMKCLSENNYIAYSASIADRNTHFDLMLLDYKKMYLKAEEGGKGYITLSEDCLTEISGFMNVNELRAYLRLYLSCDDTSVKSGALCSTKLRFSVIKNWLPSYLTKDKVCSILDKLKKYFNFSAAENDAVNVNMPYETDGKQQYKQSLSNAQEEIAEYIDDINSMIMNSTADSITRMSQLDILVGPPCEWKGKIIDGLHQNSAPVYDLARLAVQYSIDTVKQAVSAIIRNYHFKDEKILSWGALARSYITKIVTV